MTSSWIGLLLYLGQLGYQITCYDEVSDMCFKRNIPMLYVIL